MGKRDLDDRASVSTTSFLNYKSFVTHYILYQPFAPVLSKNKKKKQKISGSKPPCTSTPLVFPPVASFPINPALPLVSSTVTYENRTMETCNGSTEYGHLSRPLRPDCMEKVVEMIATVPVQGAHYLRGQTLWSEYSSSSISVSLLRASKAVKERVPDMMQQ